MGIFGKLLAEVVEAVTDTVEVGVAVTKDVVKSPLRLMGRADPYSFSEGSEDFTEDTQEVIRKIRED